MYKHVYSKKNTRQDKECTKGKEGEGGGRSDIEMPNDGVDFHVVLPSWAWLSGDLYEESVTMNGNSTRLILFLYVYSSYFHITLF